MQDAFTLLSTESVRLQVIPGCPVCSGIFVPEQPPVAEVADRNQEQDKHNSSSPELLHERTLARHVCGTSEPNRGHGSKDLRRGLAY